MRMLGGFDIIEGCSGGGTEKKVPLFSEVAEETVYVSRVSGFVLKKLLTLTWGNFVSRYLLF